MINRLMGWSSRCPIRSSHPMGTVKSRFSGRDPFSLRNLPASPLTLSRTSLSVGRPQRSRSATAIRYSPLKNTYPPSWRTHPIGVHSSGDRRPTLPRHILRGAFHIYSYPEQFNHRVLFPYRRYVKRAQKTCHLLPGYQNYSPPYPPRWDIPLQPGPCFQMEPVTACQFIYTLFGGILSR